MSVGLMPMSHPGRLALAGWMAGVETARPERCRVLELGCGRGRNVIPMAFYLDGCELVGVEPRGELLEEAVEARDRLGLDNLALMESPLDVLEGVEGVFDYVILPPGLWTEDDAGAMEILSTVRRRLAPQGMALVGYDVPAGRMMLDELSRIVRRRASGMAERGTRLREVRGVLSLLGQSPLRQSAYGELLGRLVEGLESQPDEVIEDQLLAERGRSLPFEAVFEMATAAGLAFVAEASQSPAGVAVEQSLRQSLAQIVVDRVELEELTDLMLSRPSRATLFRRADVSIGGNPEGAPARLLSVGTLAGSFAVESRRPSLEPEVNEVFVTSRGVRISVSDAVLKAALVELTRSWPGGISLEQLEERVGLLLGIRRVFELGQELTGEQRDRLRDDLLALAGLGHVDLRLWEPSVKAEPGERPRANGLTRLEAARGSVVTTPFHEAHRLTPLEHALIPKLDGRHDIDALVSWLDDQDELVALFGDEGGELPESSEARRDWLRGRVEEALRSLSGAGLFE